MERSAERRIVLFVTGLLLVAMPGQTLVAQDTLVATGSVWKYLDDGSDQGTAWYGVGFDDSGWASGPAELGYGDGDEATVVSYGPNQDNKYRTTYFRHSFSVPDASVYNSITLNVKRDDGVVVYLNGSEVFRENMPEGVITYMTPAASAVEDGSFYSASIDVSSLVNGTNVLAVEIHQHGGPSSDISFDLSLSGSTEEIVTAIVRGPYLQNGTTNGVTIMWRTSVKTSSKVWYGTSLITLDQTAEDSDLKTDHTMRISGLSPDTKYYYLIGSIDRTVLAGGDEDHYFVTNPVIGSIGAIRIWVLGDSGTADNNSRSVKNAYLELAGNEKETDIWLMLGDNAYMNGTETQYQNAVFNMYPEILRNKVLWSTRGNHEMSSSVYYGIFEFPANGEGGGLASGTEHYYSFDYANIHFICLNSQESNFSGPPDSVMYQWLEEDLANTPQEWIIAFWHHPPYSKGSHNSDSLSDSSGRLVDMRENALPILEAGGVDLVLSGHSHSYERSFFINGHYTYSSSFDPGVHVVQAGSGREDGDGAYVKFGDDGAVYIVAGSSGTLGAGSLDHPVMYFSERQLGSLIIDVQGSQMDVRFLREYTNPTQVDDYFTIQDTFLTAMLVGPTDGLPDVPPEGVVLKWIPGQYASKHDVYFGSVFDDVNNATGASPQADATYVPAGPLEVSTTYYWRVDEVNDLHPDSPWVGNVWSFTTVPGNSTQPAPANGALAVTIDATLGWLPGYTAAARDVYFGTSSPPVFIGNQEAASYYPGPLEPGTTYYWQVDEVEADGTTIYTGDIWSFTTVPGNSTQPDPANGALAVTIDATLGWLPGPTAATHNVYLGTSSPPAFIGNQTEPNFNPGLKPGTTYYWQIDEVEADGTTIYTGDIWSFTTVPGYATQPDPANDGLVVALETTLGWLPGPTASTHDVHFGSSSPPAFIGNQEGATYYSGPLEPSTTYYWQIDEVEADGTTIYTGDIWSFKTPRPGTGTILFEIWGDLGYGSAVSDLTGNSNYPHSPTFSTELMSFEAPTNISDAFGGRLHGYLHPETSGEYTFWIASNDNGELWLSTDESPGNAVKISSVNAYTDPRQWDNFPSQQSDPISLTGGEKYYIMALYKEVWSGDNCAVAWEGPDSPTRAVIAGYYLSPFVQLSAYSPSPTDGTTEVKRRPTLSWSAGINTASVNGHELYLSSDVNAVNDRIAEKVVLSEPSYSITTKLDTGKVYYWCVDEVDADGITRHSGDVWSFTVTTIGGR